MPIYRFQIDVDATPQIVAERLRSIVRQDRREPFGMDWWSWRSRDPASPPFMGTVRDDSFRLRRDIRGRNSFLPQVRGHFASIPTGTRVCVTMFVHPLVVLFMAFWLGLVGYGGRADPSANSLVLWCMFIFGIVLTTASFFPEALQAKRIISAAVLGPRPVLGL